MRVIFLSDVPGSGLAGEVKTVKNGYARNFLIPKQLAVVATHDQLQRIESIRKAGDATRIKEEQDMRALAEQLSQIEVTLTARVGPTGRLYGAVTSTHIAEELSRLTEREFDRRTIQLDSAIHEPGSYQATIRLSQGMKAAIEITVQGEDAEGRIQGRHETPDALMEQEASEVPTEQDTPGTLMEQRSLEESTKQEEPEGQEQREDS